MDLEQVLLLRETNINKYFRKLVKGADAKIPTFIKQFIHEFNCSFEEHEILDEKQINFYKNRSLDSKNYFSINRLASHYLNGCRPSDENVEMAIKLIEMLLENDIRGSGAVKMGYIYTDIPKYKNPTKAVEFTKMGCDKQNMWAMCNMGIFYEKGDNGLERDDNKAIEWYKMAVDHGSYRAKVYLADIYYKKKIDYFPTARMLCEEVINKNYGYSKADALFRIAQYETNSDKKVEFYQKCFDFCSNKDSNYNDLLWKSANNAANVYYEKGDYTKSRKLYKYACFVDTPMVISCKRLAIMCYEGKGGDKNIIQAIKYYYIGKLYSDARNIIDMNNINDNQNELLDKLTDVLSYDDFMNLYSNNVPKDIYKLLETKRLADIQIEI